GSLSRAPRTAVRVLHAGLPHDADLLLARVPQSNGRRDSRGDLGESLSLHGISEHRRGSGGRRSLDERDTAELTERRHDPTEASGESNGAPRTQASPPTARAGFPRGDRKSIGKPNGAPRPPASPPTARAVLRRFDPMIIDVHLHFLSPHAIDAARTNSN